MEKSTARMGELVECLLALGLQLEEEPLALVSDVIWYVWKWDNYVFADILEEWTAYACEKIKKKMAGDS